MNEKARANINHVIARTGVFQRELKKRLFSSPTLLKINPSSGKFAIYCLHLRFGKRFRALSISVLSSCISLISSSGSAISLSGYGSFGSKKLDRGITIPPSVMNPHSPFLRTKVFLLGAIFLFFKRLMGFFLFSKDNFSKNSLRCRSRIVESIQTATRKIKIQLPNIIDAFLSHFFVIFSGTIVKTKRITATIASIPCHVSLLKWIGITGLNRKAIMPSIQAQTWRFCIADL